MFYEGLQAYFAPILTLIIFIFIVVHNSLEPRWIRKLFIYESILLFILLMASWLDKILEGFGDDGLAFYFRKGTSFLNFAFSPLAPIIAAVLYRKKGFSRRDILFFLPEILNLTLCVVSLFTGLVFNVTPTNEYSRGALFFLPFVINGFYAGMVVFYSTQQKDRPDQKLETLTVLVLFLCIFLGVLLQLLLHLRFLIWSTAVMALVIYYMVLAYQFLIYDQLTGAFSRDGFRLNFQNRRARDGVLAMIDLNGLKEINDAQGHEVGDHALYQFSQILLHSKMRPSRLYRYGGDEFVLLVKKSNVKAVQVMLAKCAIDAAALEVPLSFSYGVVEVHNGDDFYSRLQEADTLMYEMKRTMKNGAEKKPISQADI